MLELFLFLSSCNWKWFIPRNNPISLSLKAVDTSFFFSLKLDTDFFFFPTTWWFYASEILVAAKLVSLCVIPGAMVKIHLQYKYEDVPCPFKNPVVSVALRGIYNVLLWHFSMKIIKIACISAYTFLLFLLQHLKWCSWMWFPLNESLFSEII